MEIATEILSTASAIYSLLEKVKANKKRCQRVCERVQSLEGLVQTFLKRSADQTSDEVEKALAGLCKTLNSAQQLIDKYTSANLMKRILKSSSHGDEFDGVNDRLNDAFQTLALALQLEHGNEAYKMFERISKKDQDDAKEDDAELKRMFIEYAEYVEAMQKDLEEIKTNVMKIVEMINKPNIISQEVRMIQRDLLAYDPKSLIMGSQTSKVYKGTFGGFTVAIKNYTDVSKQIDPSVLKSVFQKEVETMKRFESPNILRMFGICIVDEKTPNPQYLIIMEYCENGSLRQVLSSNKELSWIRKACMSLDAAQGLYRLHLTEEKGKVHGSISSCKFLVDGNYRVKLGGFELAKTETSLKKMTKAKKDESEITSLCYSSPELLSSIHYIYSKECEMYSFGIVLWEIATRKKPFEGWIKDDIPPKVKEGYKEPLPPDCPEDLGQQINACRAFDGSQRPSAGELVDALRSVVVQLEQL